MDVESIFDFISDTREFLVSDVLLRNLQLVIAGILQGVLSILGVAVNIFSVVIFYKLGLNSSMNVALFVMSFTDVLFSLVQLAVSCCYILIEFQLEIQFDLQSFNFFVFGNILCIICFISSWVTAFISIERCACVLIPFKVKQWFTPRRSCIAMSTMYLLALVTNLHYLYGLFLEPMESFMRGNISIYTKSQWNFGYSSETEKAIWGSIEFLFGESFTFLFCHSLLLICSILMAYGLHKCTQVRSNIQTIKSQSIKSLTANKSSSNLTSSEIKLVKLVLLLSLLTIACNLPRFFVYVSHYTVREFQLGGYINLDFLMWEIAFFVSSFVTVGNFCIYMKLNSKFKKCCNSFL